MKTFDSDLLPAIVSSPGSSLRRELRARGITQVQLARVLGRPVQFVSELINGKRILTPTTAQELEAALGISSEFWLSREAAYRAWLSSFTADRVNLEQIRQRSKQLMPAGS